MFAAQRLCLWAVLFYTAKHAGKYASKFRIFDPMGVLLIYFQTPSQVLQMYKIGPAENMRNSSVSMRKL